MIARPSDGVPLLLGATAALVWQWIADWTTWDVLNSLLEEQYPEISVEERSETLREIASTLDDEGLIERPS